MTNGEETSKEAAASAGGDDHAFRETMDEVLTLAMEYTEKASHAETDFLMGFYLRMTSRAVRCALELYVDRLEEVQKEKGKL